MKKTLTKPEQRLVSEDGILTRQTDMYIVKETEYGLYVKVTGSVTMDESESIFADIRQIFESRETGISAFVDLQNMELLSSETQAVCIKIQQMGVELGVKRVATILGNSTVAHQFKRLSLQSGIHDYERYLDAATDPDWEDKGLKWVIDRIDPDAERREQIAKRRTGKINIVKG